VRLDKKGLFSLLLGVYLLANVLELLHVNFLYITTFISFCIYILLPGFLISLILRIRKLSLWENILLIVGFGVAFLEFGGLLLNTILPLLRINNPLAFLNLLFGFDVYLLLLFIFGWVRTKPFNIQIRLPRRSKLEKAFYALPPFFPLLAALGAIILNNGGSNILTLVLLGAIGFYVLLLVFFREKISIDLYAYAIFFIGLACLLTTSLRSWYISGHDIAKEFYVFQLTNAHHIWNMAVFQDPYNACLSITILPTILTNLLSIQDIYVYKVIFQILFAATPVIVFVLAKKHTTPVLAFLSAFLFLSFPLFFTDMPMLNRQEIAFIFFGLLLYLMFLTELPIVMRRVLFLIFAISVAVSHYSTYYILVPLLIFVYIFTHLTPRSFANIITFLRTKTHVKSKSRFKTYTFLTFPMILLLLALSYFWFVSYTASYTNVGSVISEVFSKNPVKASDLSYYLLSPQIDPNQQLQEHIQTLINSEKADVEQFYSKGITSQYSTHAISQDVVAPTPLGDLLSTLHIPLYKNQEDFNSLPAAFLQILILIGLLVILSFKSLKEKIREKIISRGFSPQEREKLTQQSSLDTQASPELQRVGSLPLPSSRYLKSIDRQFLLLCLGAILLLALMIILPAISAMFGLLRVFQQFLFFLSALAVLFVYHLLFFMEEKKRILAMGTIFVLLFLNFTGFIPHLTGNYYPQINLDNSGLYYDVYYTHKSDVVAIFWLSNNYTNNDPIEADSSGTNKLLPYGNIFASNEIFPPLIKKAAYVYLKNSAYVVVNVNDKLFIVNSPKPFLDSNKNCIYNNGEISIYK